MGCPVIAYGKGGVKETVVEGKTGIFFYQLQAESLIAAVKAFSKLNFNSETIREHSLKFARSVHLEKLKDSIFTIYQDFKGEKVA